MECKKLILNNIIKVTKDVKNLNFEDIYESAESFRRMMVDNNTYNIAPIVYQLVENKITYYASIGDKLLEATDPFEFEEMLVLNNALFKRTLHTDINNHEEVLLYAKENNIDIDFNPYVVVLNLYGDIVLDMYYKILGEKNV